jgi:drug/metabolite transporter (DMT)-like permease
VSHYPSSLGQSNLIRLWIISIAASWATSFAFIKVITQAGFGPFSTAAGRSVLTVIIFAMFLAMTSHRLSRDRQSLKTMLILGVFNGLLPNVLIALAMRDVATAPAGVIQASVPILVALGAHFFLQNERISWIQALGILVGLAGVLIVIGPVEIISAQKPWVGSLAMAGAAVCYAASTLYLRAQKPKDVMSITFGSQFVSALGAVLLTLLFERTDARQLTLVVASNFFGLALIATLIPTLLYFNLVKRVAASKTALVQFLLPLFTAVYGFWLLHEPFDMNIIWGGTAILVGMFIATYVKPAMAQTRSSNF